MPQPNQAVPRGSNDPLAASILASGGFMNMSNSQRTALQKQWKAQNPQGDGLDFLSWVLLQDPRGVRAAIAATGAPFKVSEDQRRVEFDMYSTGQSMMDVLKFLPVVFGGIAAGGGIASGATTAGTTAATVAPPAAAAGPSGATTAATTAATVAPPAAVAAKKAFGWGDAVRIMGDVGTIASNASRRSAEANVVTADLQQRADQIALQRYLAGLSGANVDLQQRNFALNAPSTRASQSVRGDIMANAQDVEFSGLPSYVTMGKTSGGLRPSLMSGNTRQLGSELSRKALMDQLKGDSFAPIEPLPTAGSLPSSGLVTGLGVAGLGLDVVGSLANLHSGRSSPQPSTEMPTLPQTPLGPVGQQSNPLQEYYDWLDRQQKDQQALEGGF